MIRKEVRMLGNFIYVFCYYSGYAHGYSSEGYRRHPDYIHRSQRSYRNTNQISAHEENGVAPARFHNKSETFFLTENSTTVTAQIGSATYLPCAVRNLGSGVVSDPFEIVF